MCFVDICILHVDRMTNNVENDVFPKGSLIFLAIANLYIVVTEFFYRGTRYQDHTPHPVSTRSLQILSPL